MAWDGHLAGSARSFFLFSQTAKDDRFHKIHLLVRSREHACDYLSQGQLRLSSLWSRPIVYH